MPNIRARSILVALCLMLPLAQAQARDLKASLPFPLAPLVESKDKGILVDLLRAMAEEYKDGWVAVTTRRQQVRVAAGF